MKSPVSLPPRRLFCDSDLIPTSIRTCIRIYDGHDPIERLPCWYAVTGYDECSADLIEDPADGESILVLRQGSCSQATPTLVHGELLRAWRESPGGSAPVPGGDL